MFEIQIFLVQNLTRSLYDTTLIKVG